MSLPTLRTLTGVFMNLQKWQLPIRRMEGELARSTLQCLSPRACGQPAREGTSLPGLCWLWLGNPSSDSS